MGIKVSVVMATHNCGRELRGAVESLLTQSMPQEEFELVMVDDGSSDQTPAVARKLAQTYPNVRAERIEHTGWPSRPRNVGVRLARGEYVFLMDDDDDLFPEALERVHAFASRNGSDVLLGKEVVRGRGNPVWRTWRANVDRVPVLAGDAVDILTPHKLYRRQFLLEQDVRFPEDLTRLEDYNFNAQAFVRAEVISILADYPCYRWNADSHGIHTQSWDAALYWESFLHSLEPIERELAPGPDQDGMLVRWYANRILRRVGPKLVRYRKHARVELLAGIERVLPHFPERLDALLSPAQRMRSKLLRRGDYARLLRLSAVDAGVTLALEPAETSWQDGQLVVSGTGTLDDGTGPRLVRRVGDRLFRVLPPNLASGFARAELDVTESVEQAHVEVWVRDRGTSVEWGGPTTGGLKLLHGHRRGALQLGFTARIDPSTAAFGAPLPDGLWEVALRVDAAGLGRRTLVPAEGPAAAAQVDGRPAVAFAGGRCALLLDLAGCRGRDDG